MITSVKMVLARYFHKPMSTVLSITLFTIGVAVISLIIKSEYYLENNYKQNLAGIDLVVGAKGSPLQLILSSVLHADAPTGNIPLEEAGKIAKHPLVEKTIPIALGDNFKGFRIVGTIPEYTELYHAQMFQGMMFSRPLDVVVGANVAAQTGLTLSDNFTGVHGFMHVGHSHDEFKYTVTGILKPTGTIIDDLILTPIESVWLVHSDGHHHGDEEHGHDHSHNYESQDHDHDHSECGHNHRHSDDTHEHSHDHRHAHEGYDHDHGHSGEHHDEALERVLLKIENEEDLTQEELNIFNEHRGILTEKEHHPEGQITALLVFYRNPMAVATLPRMINENTTLQAASPALQFNRLRTLFGYGIKVFEVLAWIIILISGINIFIYLLNTINQGIREIALLRATGVSKSKIFMLILLQGAFLSIIGWVAGIILSATIWHILPFGHIAPGFTPQVIQSNLILLGYCILVAILAGIIPAIKIYNTKIHYLLTR